MNAGILGPISAALRLASIPAGPSYTGWYHSEPSAVDTNWANTSNSAWVFVDSITNTIVQEASPGAYNTAYSSRRYKTGLEYAEIHLALAAGFEGGLSVGTNSLLISDGSNTAAYYDCIFSPGGDTASLVVNVNSSGTTTSVSPLTGTERVMIAVNHSTGETFIGLDGVWSAGAPDAGGTPALTMTNPAQESFVWVSINNTSASPLASSVTLVSAVNQLYRPTGYSSWDT